MGVSGFEPQILSKNANHYSISETENSVGIIDSELSNPL